MNAQNTVLLEQHQNFDASGVSRYILRIGSCEKYLNLQRLSMTIIVRIHDHFMSHGPTKSEDQFKVRDLKSL